ncbi:MAG: hypothetical protein MZV70_45145 [Desulfobacterales bacterium]|nr:hypothetical protein [Desulfobacterales bacterium]
MGNYQLGRGELREGRRLVPGCAEARAPGGPAQMVNSSIAYARMGENDQAEKSLQEALKHGAGQRSGELQHGTSEGGKERAQAG